MKTSRRNFILGTVSAVVAGKPVIADILSGHIERKAVEGMNLLIELISTGGEVVAHAEIPCGVSAAKDSLINTSAMEFSLDRPEQISGYCVSVMGYGELLATSYEPFGRSVSDGDTFHILPFSVSLVSH